MVRSLLFGVACLVGTTSLLLALSDGADASTWPVPLRPGGTAEAQAGNPPSQPQGISASCVLIDPQVTVTWQSVSGAQTYVVLESTTSASGPFTAVASGVTSATYTTGDLSAGNYWFAVEAQIGQHWVSVSSSSSAESTIAINLLCVQP